MIEILNKDERLLLRYTPGRNGDASWIDEKLHISGSVTLRRTFKFKSDDFLPEFDLEDLIHDDTRLFVLGVKDGRYFKIDKDILDLKYDLLLAREMELTQETFIAEQNISIFKKIDNLIDEPIVIGGESENAIPLTDFDELLKNFPTSTELKRYADARVAGVLKDYLRTMSDAQKKLERYMSRKQTIHPDSRITFLKGYEPQKYAYVRDELQKMLKEADRYTEEDWQELIIDFLLLIFPKYIAVLKKLQVKDFYSEPLKAKNRFIDMALVDANGTVDIVEIKKPFTKCLLSNSKYRDNYIPQSELSGSVMQVEKYIFHLNKWGREGEKATLNKRASALPSNFEIKFTSPQAIIILGRDRDFTNEQKFDFEIIKRKYANVIDIMTYDDLLRRLDNIIAMIGRNYRRLEKNTGRHS